MAIQGYGYGTMPVTFNLLYSYGRKDASFEVSRGNVAIIGPFHFALLRILLKLTTKSLNCLG